MSDLLWTEASRDLEAEQAARSLEEARYATAGIWPFLAMAKSAQEFEQRLDLSQDHLESVANSTGCELSVLQDSLRRQHRLVAEAAGYEDDPVDHEGHDYDSDIHNEEIPSDQAEAMRRDERMRQMHLDGYDSSMAFGSRYSSVKTALQEGEDPLLWIQDSAEYGSGPEKPIEHDEGPAVTAAREADPKG